MQSAEGHLNPEIFQALLHKETTVQGGIFSTTLVYSGLLVY